MNKDEALKLLEEYLGNFAIHPLFFKELTALLQKDLKGKEKQFFDILIRQLGYLSCYGLAIASIDSHERLQGDGHDFFSIHLQRQQFNIRFLVYIDNNGKSFLLSAFNERAGNKATDYSHKIPTLQERLNYFKEGK